MSEDLSQGTFDIIWEDLYAAHMPHATENTMSVDNYTTTVAEMSTEDFMNEHGFDMEQMFNDMNENDTPSSNQHNDTETPIALVTQEISTGTNINTQETNTLLQDPSHYNNLTTVKETPTNMTPKEVISGSVTETDSTSEPVEFRDISSDDVRKLIENEDNRNTLKKTLSDVTKFQRFLATKGENKSISEIEPDILDEYLANFILSVRKPNGDEYEPCTIRNMVSSIDRKLKRQKYPYRIISEQTNAFQLSSDALHAKQKSLKRLGKGNKPMKSSPISDHEIDLLYKKDILGGKSAKALLNTVWINNCILFGLRGTKENYDLRWGDIQLGTGSDGIEYLQLQERQTKTRTGTNITDVRQVTPKIFATPEDPERCPVAMYKLYKSKRPKTFCEPDHPFYIAPRTSSQKIDEETWFMKVTIGEKKLGGLLKTMAVDGGLDSNKRLTNHSTRKHLVQKLRDSGIAPTDIMQISGHKNIQSVMNYSCMSEEKHKQCSKILSSVRPRSDMPSPSASCSNVSDAICPAQPCQSGSVQPVALGLVGLGANSSTSSCYLSSKSSPPNPESQSQYEIETLNLNQNQNCAQDCPASRENSSHLPVGLPHPSPVSSNSAGNSISVVNDTVTLNTQMNSLFSGAVLNIQNFNMIMK